MVNYNLAKTNLSQLKEQIVNLKKYVMNLKNDLNNSWNGMAKDHFDIQNDLIIKKINSIDLNKIELIINSLEQAENSNNEEEINKIINYINNLI